MQTIKLRGGPFSNTYKSTETVGERFIVRKPKKPTWASANTNNPFDSLIEYDEGHYARSNVRTRSGVVVFEWMGWIGEVIAR